MSPIGLAVGKYSGKKRFIVDLSSPHEDPLHVSINDLIDKEACSLTYVKLDGAIKAICKSGKGSLLCKFDISDAYKNLPIKPSQWLISVLNGKESITCMSDWSSVAGLQPVFLIHLPRSYAGLLAIIMVF